MAQYQITVDDAILEGLFQRDGGVAKLVESVVNQILQAQVQEQLKAAPYERTEARTGYRNGTVTRTLTTRVGRLVLRVPRVRNGEFSTELFARYQRSEQAFLLALMEMVVNGVSTRDVAKVTEPLCGTSFSKSTISDLCKRLDPIVQAWNHRSLAEHRYPFLLVDALVLRIREDGRIRSRAALIAVGVNDEGYREILGLMLGNSESESSWREFFAWLKQRGLSGVDIVVSDSHSGLVKALQTEFQGCTWQRCQTHFMRNLLDATPKALQEEVYQQIRAVLDAPDLKTARLLKDAFVEAYAEKAPKAVQVLEDGFDDVTAVLVLPERYRRRLRTTNGVERLNEEIRRRERVIRIFPNRESAIRLLGALLMEMDEEWTTGRKYLNMDEYEAWKKAQQPSSESAQACALTA